MYHVFCHMGRGKSHRYECRIVIAGDWEGSGKRDKWRLEVKDRTLVEWVTRVHSLYYTFYKEIENKALTVSNVKKWYEDANTGSPVCTCCN